MEYVSVYAKGLDFTNKTFPSMKRCYNELFLKTNNSHALKELNYPTKLKNYTSKSYYKPFVKPDIHFFTNPLFPILTYRSYFILIVACCDKDNRFKEGIPVEEKQLFVFSADKNDIVAKSNKKILFYIDDIEEIMLRRCYFQWI